MCVHVHAYMCAHVCARACIHVCACVRMCVHVCVANAEVNQPLCALGTGNGGDLGRMNCTSALKFFIAVLPKLVCERNSCFQLLLGLLPSVPSKPAAPHNPLFDEDPLNDYAEELVLMRHVVEALGDVIDGLLESKQLRVKHYNCLSAHLPTPPLTTGSPTSWWESKGLFFSRRKVEMLSPVLKMISDKINNN